LKLFFCHPPN